VPLRIVFCGTPEFGVPSLLYLLAQSDFQMVGVVTQPDRPRGRALAISSLPVKEAATAAGIPLYQPEKIRSEESFEFFKRTAADAVVIIAYGQIIPARLIEIPRLGWINLHGSLLPKYRGAAPIHRAKSFSTAVHTSSWPDNKREPVDATRGAVSKASRTACFMRGSVESPR